MVSDKQDIWSPGFSYSIYHGDIYLRMFFLQGKVLMRHLWTEKEQKKSGMMTRPRAGSWNGLHSYKNYLECKRMFLINAYGQKVLEGIQFL